MIKGRIADWVSEINKIDDGKGKLEYKDNKVEDQRKLRELNLPTPSSLTLDIQNFNLQKFLEFFSENKGIFIRIIPNEEALKKGLKKKYKFGFMNVRGCFDFITETLTENSSYQTMELNEWEPTLFGWILISNGKKVLGDISEDLDKLAHYSEIPLSTLIADSEVSNHSINWIKKEAKSSEYLVRALNLIIDKAGESYFLKGYFEGVTTCSGKNLFFDFKQDPIYFNF